MDHNSLCMWSHRFGTLLTLTVFPYTMIVAPEGMPWAWGPSTPRERRTQRSDVFGDSRDLFLPPDKSVSQLLQSNTCPFGCAPSCLARDRWGWTLDVVHRLRRRRERYCRSLLQEQRHQCGSDNIAFEKVQK